LYFAILWYKFSPNGYIALSDFLNTKFGVGRKSQVPYLRAKFHHCGFKMWD